MPLQNHSALRDLRRTRQQHRLGDTEWFDVAYRAYLFALAGVIAIVVASDAINGFVGDDVTSRDLVTRGPSILGIGVAVALGLGLRSGANGGPISIEVADIRHVLLAPISRRRALVRPIIQRVRSVVFSLGLAAGVLGQFVAREVEGSRPAWAAAGALYGMLAGALFVASAIIAHTLRMPRWLATTVGTAVIVWQTAAAWTIWDAEIRDTTQSSVLRLGPANLGGSLALWGIRQRGIDLIAVAVAAAALIVALALGGRLRIEPLARRGELVTQLRFAATVQDLRTVVMLRRQLRAETLRSRPWGARRSRPSGSAPPRSASTTSTAGLIWVRGLRSLRRLPSSRVGRIVALATAGGVAGSLSITSSPLFLIGVLVAVFLLGMEAIEPLSQEIDRPDITDSLPIERGTLFAHHLVAPALLLAVAALIGALASTAVNPAHSLGAFAIALPVAWLGSVGPVVATVLDAPSPISVAETTIMGTPRNQESSIVPPEFAGFSNAFSTLLPVILSALGVLPVLAMRADPGAGTALRTAVAASLALAMMVWWVRSHDQWAVKIRSFLEAGRTQQSGGFTA
jgi:hypothetical protein